MDSMFPRNRLTVLCATVREAHEYDIENCSGAGKVIRR